MGLLSDIKEKDKKGLFNSNDVFASYTTGLAPLDFANGLVTTKVNKDTGELEEYLSLGVMGGSFITIIGLSGSAKSTLATQIGYSIIKDFDDGIMVYNDIEKTAIKSRICTICGTTEDDERIILNKDNVSIEAVLQQIDDIASAKEAAKNGYKYEAPQWMWKDPKKPEYLYVPTVIILDSLAAFNSEARVESELEGQTAGGREAGQIAQFYTKCLNKMSKYNITIITINHIKAKIEINRFATTPPQHMMLKQGESLPRGTAPIYYAHSIFRCNATKGNMYTLEDNGFEGMMIQVQIAKTKSSFIGSTLNIAFNKDIGLDPIYTLYEFGMQAGIIEGRNPYLYFKGLEAFKFNRKLFRQKFLMEKDFREGVMSILMPYLHTLLGSKEMNDRERDKQVDLDSLMSLNDSDEIISE